MTLFQPASSPSTADECVPSKMKVSLVAFNQQIFIIDDAHLSTVLANSMRAEIKTSILNKTECTLYKVFYKYNYY